MILDPVVIMDKSFHFTKCSNLTSHEWKAINLTYSVNGAVCFVISYIIVLLLLISKSYHTLLERLFLYLMVVTSVRELDHALSVELYFGYSGGCKLIGFINVWTGILHCVFTVSIITSLFFRVLYLARGDTGPRFLKSKSQRMKLECLFVVLSSVSAFVYAFIPHFSDDYGPAGAWCWIKTPNKNCTTTLSSRLYQILSGYIFDVSGGIIGSILLILMAVVYYRLYLAPQARTLLKKTSAVIICSLLYVAAIIFALIIRMSNKSYHRVTIWLSSAILYPSGSLFFPVGFILCFYPVKNIFKSTMCEKVKKCFCYLCDKRKVRRERTVSLQELESSMSASILESSRVSSPSQTFFHVPYTNNFTHITTEHAPLLSDDSDDREYGTTIEYSVWKKAMEKA